jgi:hypothetical protein
MDRETIAFGNWLLYNALQGDYSKDLWYHKGDWLTTEKLYDIYLNGKR